MNFILQETELLVLNTLQWEISTVTSMDFLDHILMRLGSTENTALYPNRNDPTEAQIEEMKLKMEQVLVLAVTEYFFSYLSPSLLAVSAASLVLSRITTKAEMMEDLCKSIGAIPVSSN